MTEMEVVVASSLGLGSLASVAIYRFVRPLFPVTVNCHFCNGNFKVSDLTGLVCGESLDFVIR